MTPAPPSSLKDLLHAGVLLCAVPLFFYGAYALLTQAVEIQPDPPPTIIEAAPNVLRPLIDTVIPASTPPGDAWVAEIDRLKSRLATTPASASQLQSLNERLDRLREHCVARRTQVPARVGTDSLIGQTLFRIAESINQLGSPPSTNEIATNWEAEFARAEQARLQQQTARIENLVQNESRPLIAAHLTALATINRQNRQLDDDLQRQQDSMTKIRRDAEWQVAKHKRQTAYEKDKADIERLLSPFTSSAYWQLNTGSRDWRKAAESKPLSFRDLERLGALLPTIDGLRQFAIIGGYHQHVHPTTTRPLGAFPAYYDTTLSDPAKLETIKRAQRLLKEHAPYLIESGRLQP